MKTVAAKLESANADDIRVKCIWFSAWEFEKLPTPLWIVFLNRVMMELHDMVPDAGLKKAITTLGKGILLLSANVLLQKSVGISQEEVRQIKESVWEDIKQIDSLREKLSQYIEEALKNDKMQRNRLAIFIDDLDRCLPAQSVEVFESIKLFLNCQHCVFIVGVDKEQLCKAFAQKFGVKDDQKGLNYVEKFVQLQFDLPPKTPEEVKDFLFELASEQLKNNPKTIDLISKFIEPNPRKIKKWLNSVFFLERLFRIKQPKLPIGADIDVSIASIWLFLKTFFPDFARLIESDPSILNTSIKVATGEGTLEDKQKIGDFTIDKRLAEFLSLWKPSYDETQLRDIVYLSRLTPVLHISTLPKDILDRLAQMTQEDLLSQLEMLSENNILSLADRLITNLSQIQTYENYRENLGLFDLLGLLLEGPKEEATKALMLDKILDFMLSYHYAYLYFSPKLKKYVSQPELKKAVAEPGLRDKMIMVFAKSGSFDQAKQTSAVLVEFMDELTQRQVEKIVDASLENNQIYQSWGAQNNLQKVFSKQRARIPDEKIAAIVKTLAISL
jgi:hypothetical protein